MTLPQVCIPENNHTFWWLTMPDTSYCRDIVVELEYVAGNWWFVGRRSYAADDMQCLLDRGGKLTRVEKPK